ncbi:ribosome assembly RNA-binding protein YhbY [Nitrosovibrio sp. Nv6]|uniref:ribosome assembly RNA-binding protein YhbY n=1 Tax=Nitrosovibrio sp. Nv6 TaxID=1855340 RepID=UPI0008C43181|nr:ribosome assembly RNA-binding protein YhbY [Nitrosovibrio sp. Nv6]SEP04216.1 putative RNA-binding protein, YhbY family [Nitrosovibrio sp. Nv6]
MLELTLARRRDLRARAHAMKPIVWIGAAGLSEGIMRELDVGLKSHELIKVKVSSDERETRNALLEEICRRLEAVAVQHIGKILVIYRPRPAETIETAASDIIPPGNEKKLRHSKRRLST